MAAPSEITDLINRFEFNLDAYKSGQYNEIRVRIEFIDPLFEALGWDIANRQGYAEAYKDVIHEDAIKVGGVTKAPDYCFRIGGARKFFLEAKKPSVNIKLDIHPAYQLRRYAWSAKLPLSILTDFEEFAVYDCRIKPEKDDSAATARVLYATFHQYIERWDEIAGIFARESILKGSFDKYAESNKKKRGTAEVDVSFLAEIERWRELLARNIALRNPALPQRELNYAVQQTIDRIIFLRICEDRGIEPYGTLMGLQNGSNTYSQLLRIFYQADARYNSGLFHFNDERDQADAPDRLTPSLTIDDKSLKEILKNLYYPDSPYEFSVLPADILGQVYERFLGKVIRLSPGRRVAIEEKPEVRKAGGVYYTPTYIVEYIVQQTVGNLLEGKTPGPRGSASKLRILDPACGSGSFLLGAYQFLLDWHRQQYIAEPPEKWAKGRNPQLYLTAKGDWQLTIHERKRILLNNIYGVDIDPQAVEVTKLSLLLKVLEGETSQSINPQLELLPERVLPDLAHNIQCGNSLIGPDFYEGQLVLLDEENAYRINVFDWQAAFPLIMQAGGFDAVIGNPPWGADLDSVTLYIEQHYPNSSQAHKDSFKLFVDKGLELVKFDGLLSMIVPSAFMFQPRYIDLRRLLQQQTIKLLWNVGDKVFGPKVTAPCCVFLIARQSPAQNHRVAQLDTTHSQSNLERAAYIQTPTYNYVTQNTYSRTPGEAFISAHRELAENEVELEKILDCRDCGIKHQRVNVGLQQKGNSDLRERLYYVGVQEDPRDHHYLTGSDLSRTGWWIDYSQPQWFRHDFDDILRDNEIVYFNRDVFDLPEKIVWRQTSDRIRATIIGPHWFANTLQAGVLRHPSYDLRYVLGLLNSRYLNTIYIETVKELGRVFPQVKLSKVRSLPFRTINFQISSERVAHNRMVALVQHMLDLHKHLATATLPHQPTLLQRQIDITDHQIDALVYELYGLTEEEIAIVESNVV